MAERLMGRGIFDMPREVKEKGQYVRKHPRDHGLTHSASGAVII